MLARLLLPMPLVWFHVHFWTSLVAPTSVAHRVCATAGIAAVYIADRIKLNPEDDGPVTKHQNVLLTAFALCCAVSGSCVVLTGDTHMLRTTLAFIAIAVWYGVKIPLLGRRIKNLFPLSKVVFVAAMHACWPFAVCGIGAEASSTPVPFVLFCSFLLSVSFMDVKDIDGDRRAGVITIPTLLGRRLSLLAIGTMFVALTFRTSIQSVRVAYLIVALNLLHCGATSRVPGFWSLWFYIMLPPLVDWI